MSTIESNDAEQQHPKPKNPRIALDKARHRVKLWLEAAGQMPPFKDDHDSIPRAIFIELDDIKDLLEDNKGKDVTGIRVYFGLHEADSKQITGLVVPVIKMHDTHKDVVLLGDDPERTAIYDFTAPCPIYCDQESELYVPYEESPTS